MDRQNLPDWWLRPVILKSAFLELEPSTRSSLKRWALAVIITLVTIITLACFIAPDLGIERQVNDFIRGNR
jgi:hypothetical protein